MFAKLLASSMEARGQATDWGTWPGDSNPLNYSGVSVDSNNATQLLCVYGCARLIADSIATLPMYPYRQAPDGTKTPLTPPIWWDEPSSGTDRVTWVTQILLSLLLDGNAFVAVMRNASGQIVDLLPLNSRAISARKLGTQVGSPWGYFMAGQQITFPMLHLRGITRAGQVMGMSPVEAARQMIGAGMAAQEFAGRFFAQGAVTSGIIKMPDAPDQAKAKETARVFAKTHAGKNNAHKVGVLMGGAEWQVTGVTNEQAQFLETRQFTDAQIAGQMFLIDPTDLGIPVGGTTLTYASLEQRNMRRVQVTLMPWIVRLENAISSLFPRPQYVKIDLDELLRADALARAQIAKIRISNRLASPNEIRREEDEPPLTDGTGDQYFGPMSPGNPAPEQPAADAADDTGAAA